MVGTYAGARLATFVSDGLQLALFALVMAAAAFFMLRDRRTPDADREPHPAAETSAGLIIAEGITVGIVTGLVGIGGGFLIVPALVLLARPVDEGSRRDVVGNRGDELVAGTAGYVGQVEVPWGLASGFAAAALVGVTAGTMLARHVQAAALQRAFALLLAPAQKSRLHRARWRVRAYLDRVL